MEIVKLEDIVAQTTAPRVESMDIKSEGEDSDDNSDDSLAESNKNQKLPILYGRPKSGRVWKERKSRFSSIIKTPGIRSSKVKKDAVRLELKRVKEHSRALVEERKKEKEEKRHRREANLKRREENRLKSEIVQVIKNTSKIRRMKKKQLRQIEKRDTATLIKRC